MRFARDGDASGTSQSYDTIVIGAGVGGIVTATKLVEAGEKVLLLERGGPSTFATGGRDQPSWLAGSDMTIFDLIGFKYALRRTQGLWDTQVNATVPSILGGGGAVNAQQHWWPLQSYWDKFTGWSASEMAGHVAAASKRIPTTIHNSPDGKFWGTVGIHEAGQALARTLGWRELDFSANTQDKDGVFGRNCFSVREGERGGVLTGYLPDALKSPNFKMMLDTEVVEVIRQGLNVTGVRTKTETFVANKVVLSAGVFNTVRHLFLLGIGPDAQVAASGSKVHKADWINLPVGEGVHDNAAPISFRFNHTGVISFDYSDPLNVLSKTSPAAQRALKHTGELTWHGTPSVGFWSVKASDGGPPIYLQTALLADQAGHPGSFGLTCWLAQGLRSRGVIGIEPSGYMKLIKSPWTSDEKGVDLQAAVDGCLELLNAAKKTEGFVPDAASAAITDAASMRAAILAGTDKGNTHWGGGANLGSVVDNSCRVKGMSNLYVSDASVRNEVNIGNSQAPVIVVAEKCASEIIKAQ
ncbi:uncharacterized protein L969DRAFT_90395 [Mixia osmundae IAM 14324]|uniref:uncharacterized protein n=1 Tax=Mixia osmundae (strain CBS 9802 / IAM 14324 / JCM 22182 / KY 12970) TaxID=764103 RepID=UPI0004A553FA|nr:uncharacterized protein L969DRAFT_90395 [Mixia osmundae IAM 14324]KEI36859.1 hypothetical protein L969DRAFT_90395 [Mixia osmundae IAM 14324]